MKRLIVVSLTAAVFGGGLSAQGRTAPPKAAVDVKPVSSVGSNVRSSESQNALLKQYCVTCHNDTAKRGDLSLADFDVAHADEHAPVAEKMIRKLRAGMMPPAGMNRPTADASAELVAALETRLDQASAAKPNPGRRPFQRLNRAEYARAVSDLLDITVDVNAFLPADVISSRGFDNSANEQILSATLMNGYLRAASAISRLAVGDANAAAAGTTYLVPDTTSQVRHVEGAPVGTRGGVSVVHVFPADGEYTFNARFFGGPVGDLFGGATMGAEVIPIEQIEISINGERAAILSLNAKMQEADPRGLSLETERIYVKAGPQRVSAAFIQTADGPVNDLIAPIEFTVADTNIGGFGPGFTGITSLAHVRDFTITGPYKVTGVSETPSRRRIFTCRPTKTGDEQVCATSIIKHLATQAYRGVLKSDDLAELMRFYTQGRSSGDFESGVRLAIQAMLASPRFLFRLEPTPSSLKPGQNQRVGDLALASRLSFFLWAAPPDAKLIEAATEGTLTMPAVLEKQVRRMLADRRAEALGTRFAAQWLRLRDLEAMRPDHLQYPQWDQRLVESSQRETELFFNSLVREDRSLLDLITADYTFVNERLAKHYGIPNVMGTDFVRVTIPDERRRGILGQASVLMLTSVADRTSPVQRGKWVMETLLGSPPPPPPPNVPAFEETQGVKGGKLLSVRERMEAHRANPACSSCHKMMDPLGLALENFDPTGAWRANDGDVAVDASGVLFDGTKLDGPASLRAALLKHADVVALSFTDNLMTYALGRPVDYYDMPSVRAIVRDAARSGNRMSSFILGIIKSPAFQLVRGEDPLVADAGAPAAPATATAARTSISGRQ